jgi:hypothetical protein
MADYAQRTVSLMLMGLTVYGLVLLGKGGRKAWNKRKERKALESSKNS